ncbi:efflux RND transporter permease subunit [Halothermothrix orenii]|uniref:Predicted exporters of the RND superfamily n=1 Tax=Halothermothrix orenii (strain H 168 / OCM 544 / DSM 9562) TaxID=373903 RepID=B8D267_HALOH|nr:MMPL family transporter [Halothermothrix orenii]ACL69294.1 predicted exporters of the RND superfamily [Halothermothrix orenii H 168]
MDNYVRLINNNKRVFTIIFIMLNILSLIGLFKLKINPDFDIFMLRDSHYKKVLDDMNQTFNTTEQTIILIETENKEINPDTIHKFRSFQKHLEKINSISYINGPAPRSISFGNFTLDLEKPINELGLKFLKEHFKGMGKLSTVTRKNGKLYGIFTIFPGENFSSNDLKNIESYLQKNGLNYYLTGDMYMQHKIIDYIYMILLFLPPTALLLILTVFRTQMGTLKATFLSILPAGIAALWTMGIIGWIGKPVSVITVLAPIFTIVIGSADGLHFVSHVQDTRAEGKDKIKSIVETLKMVGIPMIITTVTSMAGFLALLVMNTDAIHDLALFASLGIFLAGVATWYILPLILTGNVRLKKHSHKRSFLASRIRRLWGVPSIIILFFLITISIIGGQYLSTEFNQLLIYRNFTDVYKSFDKIMEVNEGSIPVYLYVKTENDPLSPINGKRMIELGSKLTQSDCVTKTVSVYDAYSLIYSAIQGLSSPQYPENKNKVAFVNNLITAESNNPTSHLINRDNNATRMLVFPANLKNKILDRINKIVTDYDKKYPDLTIEVTGVQYLMRELSNSMISNQTQSILLAFSLIFILLYISIRKIKPSVISLLPIAFTTLIIFGFMGLSGISLNLFTATIFSITIGVGIDYAVHFTSVWMTFRKRGYTAKEATNKSYKYTARPIIANAFGLAIGLSALTLSPLRIHLYVSVLMWVAMISGVFLSLSFLPTILKSLGNN